MIKFGIIAGCGAINVSQCTLSAELLCQLPEGYGDVMN